jgi:hypothetical protein
MNDSRRFGADLRELTIILVEPKALHSVHCVGPLAVSRLPEQMYAEVSIATFARLGDKVLGRRLGFIGVAPRALFVAAEFVWPSLWIV